MSMKRFEVDRANGKVLGVCAGLAVSTGLDVTVVRIGAVLTALLVSVPWIVILYVVLGIVGSRAARGVARSTFRRAAGREQSRERMRDLDVRMQAIDTYV